MKLSKSTKAVLDYITLHAKNGKLITSNARIAAAVNVTDRTVQLATNFLRDNGYIQKNNREVDDHRSGKKKNLCNEYIVIDSSNEKKSTGGLRNFSPYKDLKDFKPSLKQKDLKQEEDRMREQSISDSFQEEKQTTPQLELLEQIDICAEQKKTVQTFISHYPVEVVRYCMQKFQELNAKGLIVSIVGWIRSVLANESKRFLQFGFCGFKKQKSPADQSQQQKSLRHKVTDSLEKLHKNRMNLRYLLNQAKEENRTDEERALREQLDAAEALFRQANEKTAKRVESSIDLTCSDDGKVVTSADLEAVREKIKAYKNSLQSEAVRSV